MSTSRIDELRSKFDENPRRYFAPLANEYRKAGDLTTAIALCREHLPKQPGHMSGHIIYGQALYEAGALDESRQVFEAALALDPENLIALRHLCDIARTSGDNALARRWYERMHDADPRNDEIAQQLATFFTPATAMPAIVPAADAPTFVPDAETTGWTAAALPDASPEAVSAASSEASPAAALEAQLLDLEPTLEPTPPTGFDATMFAPVATPDADMRAVDDHDASAHHASENEHELLDVTSEFDTAPAAAEERHLRDADFVDAFDMGATPAEGEVEAAPAEEAMALAEQIEPRSAQQDDAQAIDDAFADAADDTASAGYATLHTDYEVSMDGADVVAAGEPIDIADALDAFGEHDPVVEIDPNEFGAPTALADVDAPPSLSAHDFNTEFEEGLIAPEWPDTSALFARSEQPHRATPVTPSYSQDAVSAFGRETVDPVSQPADDEIEYGERESSSDEFSLQAQGGEPELEVASGHDVAEDVVAEEAVADEVVADEVVADEVVADEVVADGAADPDAVAADTDIAVAVETEAEDSDAFVNEAVAEPEPSSAMRIDEAPEESVADAEMMWDGEDSNVELTSARELEAESPDADLTQDFEIPLAWREAPAVVDEEREAPAVVDEEREAPAVVDEEHEAPAVIDEEREAPAVVEAEQEASAIVEAQHDADDVDITSDDEDVLDTSVTADDAQQLETIASASEEVQEVARAIVRDSRASGENEAIRVEMHDGSEDETAVPARALHPTPAQPAAAMPSHESPAFVTETMAELLISQGFIQRAATVYEELVRRRPYDPVLVARLEELRERLSGEAEPSSTSAGAHAAADVSTDSQETSDDSSDDASASESLAAASWDADVTDDYEAQPEHVENDSVASTYAAEASMPTPIVAPRAVSHERPEAEARITARERFARIASRRVPRRTPPRAAVAIESPADGLAGLFGAADDDRGDDYAARAFADAFAPMDEPPYGASHDTPAFVSRTVTAPSSPAVHATTSSEPSHLTSQATPSSARPSSGFSFDRFFPDPATVQSTAAATPTATPATQPSKPAPAAPASSAAQSPPLGDDLAEFAAWLKGLDKP